MEVSIFLSRKGDRRHLSFKNMGYDLHFHAMCSECFLREKMSEDETEGSRVGRIFLRRITRNEAVFGDKRVPGGFSSHDLDMTGPGFAAGLFCIFLIGEYEYRPSWGVVFVPVPSSANQSGTKLVLNRL